MITKDHAQEGLSRAYIHAISAAARVNAIIGGEFDYGFDGTFSSVTGRQLTTGVAPRFRYVNDGYPIDFQLKCSWNWTETPDHITWSIKTKTYNDLVIRNSAAGGVRALLILMCLHEDEATWIDQNEDRILLKRCCYYEFLTGDPVANENSTKLLRIPRTNLLTPNALVGELEAEKRRMMGQFDD